MKILKFSMDSCQPCKMLSKILTEVNSPVPIEEINIDSQMDLTAQYRIRGVPTCVLVDDEGNEIRRKVGMMNENEFKEFVGFLND